MNTAKRRYSVLILCTAISLGLMALSASAAQATTWMVNGSNVEADLSVGLTSIATEKSITLLSTVSGKTAFSMSCEKLEFRNAVLHAGGLATAEFWWSGCQVKLNGTLSAACKPQEPIKLGDKSKDAKAEGKDEDEMEPSGMIDLGEECPVGELFKLSGIYWIEDTSNEWEVEKLAHTVREATGVAKTFGGLFFGTQSASIDGGIKLELNDGGAKKFSALF